MTWHAAVHAFPRFKRGYRRADAAAGHRGRPHEYARRAAGLRGVDRWRGKRSLKTDSNELHSPNIMLVLLVLNVGLYVYCSYSTPFNSLYG